MLCGRQDLLLHGAGAHSTSGWPDFHAPALLARIPYEVFLAPALLARIPYEDSSSFATTGAPRTLRIEALWAILGSWAALGLSWAALGPSGAVLEPSWAALGSSWEALGPSWAAPGPSWAAPGPSFGRSWAVLGCLGRAKRSPRGVKMRWGVPPPFQIDL